MIHIPNDTFPSKKGVQPGMSSRTYEKRSYRHFDEDHFMNRLKATLRRKQITILDNVNVQWDLFYNSVKTELDLMCPIRNFFLVFDEGFNAAEGRHIRHVAAGLVFCDFGCTTVCVRDVFRVWQHVVSWVLVSMLVCQCHVVGY